MSDGYVDEQKTLRDIQVSSQVKNEALDRFKKVWSLYLRPIVVEVWVDHQHDRCKGHNGQHQKAKS